MGKLRTGILLKSIFYKTDSVLHASTRFICHNTELGNFIVRVHPLTWPSRKAAIFRPCLRRILATI